MLVSPTHVTACVGFVHTAKTGPYVDRIVYKVIPDMEDRVLAIQAGEIEMDLSFTDAVRIAVLEADPDIDIYEGGDDGFGHITINCAKYPLNISGFRRALAYAFDKTATTTEVLYGYAQEHDSLVPYANGWCIEDEFDWHYYTEQSEIGNQILDDLNFVIDSGTGYRRTPNGSVFDISIEYSAGASSNVIGIVQKCKEALQSLHVDADTLAADFNGLVNRLDTHGDFDMAYFEFDSFPVDVDWLAYEYWSEYADVEYQNWCSFRNETYDSLRTQLLFGTSYEDVYEAAAEMQKVLHYNVPRLVVNSRIYIQAYRNDQFTNHSEDLGRYISGHWTMRKIQKLDGTYGGTVPIAISEEPDSFNIYVANSAQSRAILSELWPSLYSLCQKLRPRSNLAENMMIQTHSDNPAVPDGHTRFTVDIIQNATWSDGEPITAEDVAFSYVYAFESAPYGNPAGSDIGDLAAVYAPTTFRVVIEFNTESYWHFSNFAYDTIIPAHIFNDDTGIGYQGWNTWNPMFDPAEPNVNCGPFVFSDFEAGEFYEISFNPLFHYAATRSCGSAHTTTTTTTTTNSSVPPPQDPIPNPFQDLVVQFGPIVVFVAMVTSISYFGGKRVTKL